MQSSSDNQTQMRSQGTADQTGVAGELKSDAQHLGKTAADRVHSELDARKGTAASQAQSLSSAIDRAAGELDTNAPDWLRNAFQQGARQVQKFADTLEQKDSRQILDDINSFARDHPGTFLAGCAAAGFAAARVFKAGASENTARGFGQTRFERGQPSGTAFPNEAAPASPRGEFV